MRRTFELASRPDAIAPALDTIETGLAGVGVAQELALRLITEEVITNVVKYAEAETIRIDFKVSDITVVLEVRDNGKRFDPLGAAAPDLEASVKDRRRGARKSARRARQSPRLRPRQTRLHIERGNLIHP